MSARKKIFVAGHRGLVGSAILRAVEVRAAAGEPWEVVTRTRHELDLLDAAAVREFMLAERPGYVVIAAAKVGGIKANNDFPVDFLLDNLKIQNGLIEAAYAAGVGKLRFLGSSCIFPKFAPQPIHEESLLTGSLEPTNEAYAIAKIAGIKLCQAYRRQHGADFISAMPTNMYGPFDNYDLQTSHVLPAMIHKFHLAKAAGKPTMTLWGTGSPRREFLHSEDLASACLLLLENYSAADHINIGSGTDVTIKELAETVRDVVGFRGEIEWDTTQPDGTPRKLMDNSRIRALGWEPKIGLTEGIRSAYQWFLDNHLGAKAA